MTFDPVMRRAADASHRWTLCHDLCHRVQAYLIFSRVHAVTGASYSFCLV